MEREEVSTDKHIHTIAATFRRTIEEYDAEAGLVPHGPIFTRQDAINTLTPDQREALNAFLATLQHR
jgi:ABC-type phosphate/phosphonate transport system substrate-binding protein